MTILLHGTRILFTTYTRWKKRRQCSCVSFCLSQDKNRWTNFMAFSVASESNGCTGCDKSRKQTYPFVSNNVINCLLKARLFTTISGNNIHVTRAKFISSSRGKCAHVTNDKCLLLVCIIIAQRFGSKYGSEWQNRSKLVQ